MMKEYKQQLVSDVLAAAEELKIISFYELAKARGLKHMPRQDVVDVMRAALKQLPNYRPVQLLTPEQERRPSTDGLFTTLHFIQNDVEFEDYVEEDHTND